MVFAIIFKGLLTKPHNVSRGTTVLRDFLFIFDDIIKVLAFTHKKRLRALCKAFINVSTSS